LYSIGYMYLELSSRMSFVNYMIYKCFRPCLRMYQLGMEYSWFHRLEGFSLHHMWRWSRLQHP